jgi:phenylacetate-CoA ligase
MIWPGLSYDVREVLTANLFKDALHKRMLEFKSSLVTNFDYSQKAVDDFNEWIRAEIPRYGGYAAVSAISDLPVTDKSQIRRNPKQFTARTAESQPLYLKQTTGSTGPPQQFSYSAFFHHETVLLSIPKIACRLGLRPLDSAQVYSLTIRDKPTERPIIRFDSTGAGGTGIRVGVDTASPQSVRDVIALAAEARPFCISSGPTVLAAIAESVPSDLAAKVGASLIVSGGSHLADEIRLRIASLFKAKVVSAYGLSEFGVVASECNRGKLHFNTCDCHVEVTPPAVEASSLNPMEGELIITSTKNRVMPFIRYRTGDIGSVAYERCDCGEPSPVLRLSAGRTLPVFRLPSGVVFSPTQFSDTFAKFPWIGEFQVIQTERDKLEVLVETKPEEDVDPERKLNLRRHFAGRLEPGVNVEITPHRFLFDAKFQRYKSLLN